jgi:hypothetical protein
LRRRIDLRRDFHELVLADIGERLFQRHLDRRREDLRFVCALGGADVGKLLALDDVELEVIAARVLANDHAGIDLGAVLDEHGSAVLQVEDGIGHSLAFAVRQQRAGVAAGDFAEMRRIGMEQAVHDGRAARVGQKFRLVADQAARRRVEDDALAAHPRGACRAFRRLRSESFCTTTPVYSSSTSMMTSSTGSSFSPVASSVLEHHAGTADGQFEAFAAHGFDENAELQFATAGDFKGIGFGFGWRDA